MVGSNEWKDQESSPASILPEAFWTAPFPFLLPCIRNECHDLLIWSYFVTKNALENQRVPVACFHDVSKKLFHKNEPDMSVSKRIAMEATRIYIRKMLFLSSLPLCGYKKKAAMAGMKGKSGPPGNMNAFKHGLAAIQKRREESTITDTRRASRSKPFGRYQRRSPR
jgi:hypothetical protein